MRHAIFALLLNERNDASVSSGISIFNRPVSTFWVDDVSDVYCNALTMRQSILSFLLVLCLGTACEDDKNDSRKLLIMTGKVCGWCGGSDSLAINSHNLVYEFRGECGSPDKSIAEVTQSEEWRELRSALNWEAFKKIDVNTCALCADGCDTWIRIQNGVESHYIRFTESSSETEPISIFAEKLKALHDEYRQK